jgi:hypothetical protein
MRLARIVAAALLCTAATGCGLTATGAGLILTGVSTSVTAIHDCKSDGRCAYLPLPP